MQRHLSKMLKLRLQDRLVLITAFTLSLLCFTLHEYRVNVRPVSISTATENGMLFYWRAYGLIVLLLAVVFAGVVFFFSRIQQFLRGAQENWRRAYTVALLLLENLTATGLMVFLSNKQFGAFDQSIVVDTLWRQATGQVPYRDFVTTNPPVFVLGLHLAAMLFGANWNAQALMLACFSGVTSLWVYWLCRKLGLSRPIAALGMLCSQIPGLLLLSFWWFNNTTAVIAGLFLLSSLCLLQFPNEWRAQTSYTVALALLLLVKPNTAGLAFALVTPLLLFSICGKLRFLLLTLLGIGLSVAALLACHVSPTLVLQSYAAVAHSRGLAFLAFRINPFYTAEIYFQFLCFSGALLLLVWKLGAAARERSWQSVARYLLLLVVAFIGVFALASNGDIADVALPPTLLAICVVVFESNRRQRYAVVFYTAFLCATLSTEAFKGITRFRIRLIGVYFLSPRLIVPVQNTFFAHLRAGPLMNTTERDVAAAVEANPGPYFLTDRMEWAYAANKIPSPRDLPVFWQAGTSFGVGQEKELVNRWSAKRFPTVLQGRIAAYGEGDWIYSPESLHQRLAAEYVKDDKTYPWVIVWHHR